MPSHIHYINYEKGADGYSNGRNCGEPLFAVNAFFVVVFPNNPAELCHCSYERRYPVILGL